MLRSLLAPLTPQVWGEPSSLFLGAKQASTPALHNLSRRQSEHGNNHAVPPRLGGLGGLCGQIRQPLAGVDGIRMLCSKSAFPYPQCLSKILCSFCPLALPGTQPPQPIVTVGSIGMF